MNKFVFPRKDLIDKVIRLIKRREAPKPTGRWDLKNNEIKSHWSNMDHCGCCGPFDKKKLK